MKIVLSLFSSFALFAFRACASVLIFVLNIVRVVITDSNLLYLLCTLDPSFLWSLKAKDKQERERIFMVMICFDEGQKHSLYIYNNTSPHQFEMSV